MNIKALHSKDCYKIGHPFQYPDKTEVVYSNFTPRSGRLSNTGLDYIVWFGLQDVLQWMLIDEFNNTFFNLPMEEACRTYKRRVDSMLGPDSVDMEHIKALHCLGYLPVEIKALPEGSKVPYKVPVFTARSTLGAELCWVAQMLETVLSAECWKPATTATTAHAYRILLEKYTEQTGSPMEFVDWQGHDFSMRGMSGVRDAARNGVGHLLSFTGTDTIPAIDHAEDYYFADSDKELIGGSIPASEHSTMCAGGQENEQETIRRLICDVYPEGNVAVVIDTWNFWNVITNTVALLKEDILARKQNALGQAKVVFRPDSGDPVKVICGVNVKELAGAPEDFDMWKEWVAEDMDDNLRELTPHGKEGWLESVLYSFAGDVYEVSYEPDWNRFDQQYYYIDNYGSTVPKCTFTKVELTPEQKGAAQCLWDEFGGTETEGGYKVLHERVGLIYGDSITLERAEAILEGLEAKGFASCNIVFGIGSYTYQYVTRDTHGFAMKATWAQINGEEIEIFKDPITDDGTKKSAKGLLRVAKENGKLVMYDQQTKEQEKQGELRTVFKDGILSNMQSLADIRLRLNGVK